MRITCPQCGFSRQVPDEKIPETTELATCPKCSHRFRFRTLEQAPVQIPDQAPGPAPAPKDQAPKNQATDEEFWAGVERMAPPPDHGADHDADHGPDNGPIQAQAQDTTEVEIEVPFERLDKYGFFPGLWLTIRRAMLSPRLFFRVMPMKGIAAPLAFYLLLFEFSLVLDLVWAKVGLPPISSLHPALFPLDPGVGGPVGPVTLFVMYPAMAAMIAFGASAAVHLVLRLMRSGERGFEGTFRAQAYSNAPLILSVFPYGYLAGLVWGLALFVIGLKNVHRTSGLKVALAFAVILGLQVLMAWWAVQAGLRALPPGMTGGVS